MSTIKVVNVQHPSAGNPSITLDAAGGMSGAFPSPNRNLLYNGAMQVAQRGTSSTGLTGATVYNTADRWGLVLSGLGTWTQTVKNDAPTGSGFRKSLKMLCTTADSSPSASDYHLISQKIEGQDVQRVAKGTASAQQLTLSFWAKSNVTGTYIVELSDVDNTRRVSASYTVSASATWERKTITFPADTTGAFDNDNGESLVVEFWLGAGSNFTSGSLQTTWGATNQANRAVGQTNLAAATNNYWQVTGVQLETGAVATPFEFKPFGQELAECERYCQRIASGTNNILGIGTYVISGKIEFPIFLSTTMRTRPELTATSGTGYYEIYRAGAGDSFDSLNLDTSISTSKIVLLNSGSGISGTPGDAGSVYTANANSSILLSAEL